jgi:aspartate/methionine/tyrosine aminotransferase
LFLNIEKTLQEQDINVDQFLRKCLQHNIILAPGTSFGEGYDNYVRICFTAAPLDKVLRGVHVLRELCG